MSRATERLRVLAKQVEANDAASSPTLARRLTSAQENGSAAAVHAIPLPEKLSDDEHWRVYRSTHSPKRLVSSFPPPGEHIGTLYDNLEAAAAKYPNEPYLGTRQRDRRGKLTHYDWITYGAAAARRTAVGSGLLALGVASGAAVGLYGVNSAPWVLTDCALHAYSMVAVPLYDTLGPDVVQYIAAHAELAAVACAAPLLGNLMAALPECPTVRLVVVWGSEGLPLPAPSGRSDVRIVRLEDVERLGSREPRAHLPPRPRDIATISYTSGTTGVPKGAVLTHGNLIADSAGCAPYLDFRPGDVHISYLPLAHIYERVNLLSCTHFGAAVGFFSGDVSQLLEDIAELRPTVFCSVPRLWNRIYDKVMQQVRESNAVSRSLFEAAYRSKKAALERGDLSGGPFAPLWDRLVFSKVKARLGGRVRLLTTGASPISDEVMAFLRICFAGATVLEGYGMTESACTICMTRPGNATTGNVGSPLPCCEVKLVDVPEMNYTHGDRPHPRGEVCVRGPIVFQGYHKNEQQTREVLDEEGWLHTGDIGTWLPGGLLKIIDRKKNIFKLAQGEYIAPEKVESVYSRSPLVAQSFVYGDSLKSRLVAVVVPDPDALLPWAAERGMPRDLARLCADANVTAAVLRSMQQEGQAAQLKGFEQVQAIHLTPEPFAVENGLMTPTFKLKRPQAKEAFQAAISAMYVKLDAAA